MALRPTSRIASNVGLEVWRIALDVMVAKLLEFQESYLFFKLVKAVEILGLVTVDPC